MVLWGRSILGRQKVPRKVPPRFRQGFVVSLVLWGRSVFGFHQVPRKVPRKVPPRFHQGSAKVPPRFHQGFTKVPPRFHQVSPSFVVSPVLWGRSVLGLPRGSSWAAKRFCGRFHQGFIEVPPSFSKFRGVSGSLGQIRPWAAKRFILGCQKVLWKVPPRFHRGSTKVSPRLRKFRDRFSLPSLLYVCLPVPSTFFASFWTELALGSSAIVKVLGHNDTFFSRGSSEKVLWRVPPTILYISLPNGCYFIKSSLEGSANCGLHLPPSLLLGSKLRELLTCLNHTNPAPRKRPIISLLLGYSLGLFPSKRNAQLCLTILEAWLSRHCRDPGRPMELIAF